jgi:hypothetical protein
MEMSGNRGKQLMSYPSPIYSLFIFDAGTSPTTRKRGTNANAFWHMMNCLKCFEVRYTKRK